MQLSDILPAMPDQIAYAAANREDRDRLLTAFGTKEPWTEDTVAAEGTVHGIKGDNVAELRFNYDILGLELEVLLYTEGPNWLRERFKDNGTAPTLTSHWGWHMGRLSQGSIEVVKDQLAELFGPPVQEVRTVSHTNDYVINAQRRYHYVIFSAWKQLGFDIKIIDRLDAKTGEPQKG